MNYQRKKTTSDVPILSEGSLYFLVMSGFISVICTCMKFDNIHYMLRRDSSIEAITENEGCQGKILNHVKSL